MQELCKSLAGRAVRALLLTPSLVNLLLQHMRFSCCSTAIPFYSQERGARQAEEAARCRYEELARRELAAASKVTLEYKV